MKLIDITDKSQFPAYYKEHNLNTFDEKRNHFRQETGAVSRFCHGTSEEDMLTGMEETVLFGIWRHFHERNRH